MSALARAFCAAAIFLLFATTAHAQTVICPLTPDAATSNQDCANTAFVHKAISASSFGLTVGTTTISGGSNGSCLFDNSGLLGEQACSVTPTTRQFLPVTSFFVTATGNDSNDCEAATVTGGHGPCLTTQHAVNVMLGFDFNQQQPTLNIGTGTFAGFGAIGPVVGCNLITVDNCFIVAGAGSGNTTLTSNNPSDATQPDIGLSGAGMSVNITALKLSVASGGKGVNINTWALLGIGSNVIFNGTDTTSVAIFADSFGFVASGAVSVTGTFGLYFSAFNTAYYENFSGAINFAGPITTFASLDLNAAMTLDGGISFSGSGAAADVAYKVSGNSSLSAPGLVSTWISTGGGDGGISVAGGRAVNGTTPASTIVSSTGFGTSPTIAVATGSSAFSTQITVTASTTPSSSGTLVVQLPEFIALSGNGTGTFIVTLQNGTGSFNAAAVAHLAAAAVTGNGPKITIDWSNGGSNLTNGSTYIFNITGQS